MLGIFFRGSDSVYLICSGAYSEPCQTCKMEHFGQGSEYVSDVCWYLLLKKHQNVDGQTCDLLPITSRIFAESVFSSSLDGIYIPFDQFLWVLLPNGIDNRAIKI